MAYGTPAGKHVDYAVNCTDANRMTERCQLGTVWLGITITRNVRMRSVADALK